MIMRYDHCWICFEGWIISSLARQMIPFGARDRVSECESKVGSGSMTLLKLVRVK
jgi:hypothetical protein